MAGRGPRAGIGGVARAALAAPGRLERALVPLAWAVGWLGLAALAGTGALALLPEERWPSALRPDHLVLYAVASLAVASLLGWGCMHEGETRLRRALGRSVAAIVFVALPLAAALLSLLEAHDLGTPPSTWEGGHWLMLFARWYTPVVVVVSLGAYVTWKTRPRHRVYLARGALFALLVTPYALLLAIVVFHAPAPGVEGPVHDLLGTIGEGSIVVQLAIGYFLGDGGTD